MTIFDMNKYSKSTRNLLLLFLLISSTGTLSYAQEQFYLKNGTSKPNRWVEANDSEVRALEQKGSNQIKRGYPREDVLVAFNSYGLFFLIEHVSSNPEISRTSLERFYNTSGLSTDLLITTTPVKVIPVTVSMYSDAVNYLTKDGKPASMNKNDVVAIIFKNGEHKFFKSPAEVIDLLKIANDSVREYFKSPDKKNQQVATDTISSDHEAKANVKLELTEQDLKEYKQKSLDKVEQFSNYLQLIADKSFSMNDRETAITNALKLFLPNSTIQVSSKSRKKPTTLSLEAYLKRLKMLPYGKVQIKWTNIEYVKELKQKADGNFYGIIVGSQKFTGYAKQGQSISYSDVTKKSVEVKIAPDSKEVDGETKINWTVLLGEIGVESEEL